MRPISGPRRAVESTGRAITRRLDDRTLETVFEGYVTPAVVAQASGALFPLADARASQFWLVDTVGVTGYDPALRHVAGDLLAGLRARGTRQIVAAITSNAVRMIGMALALATGLPIRIFATRAEAVEYIAAQRAA